MPLKPHKLTFGSVVSADAKTLCYLRRKLKPGVKNVRSPDDYIPNEFEIVMYEGDRLPGDIALKEGAKFTISYNA